MGYSGDSRRFSPSFQIPGGFWVPIDVGSAYANDGKPLYSDGQVTINVKIGARNRPLKSNLKFSVQVVEFTDLHTYIYDFDVNFTRGILSIRDNTLTSSLLLEPTLRMKAYLKAHTNIFTGLEIEDGFEDTLETIAHMNELAAQVALPSPTALDTGRIGSADKFKKILAGIAKSVGVEIDYPMTEEQSKLLVSKILTVFLCRDLNDCSNDMREQLTFLLELGESSEIADQINVSKALKTVQSLRSGLLYERDFTPDTSVLTLDFRM
jgi:hypothetical protein